jgi:hypothetical protein
MARSAAILVVLQEGRSTFLDPKEGKPQPRSCRAFAHPDADAGETPAQDFHPEKGTVDQGTLKMRSVQPFLEAQDGKHHGDRQESAERV